MIGGDPSSGSVEFWSPEEGSCLLSDYPRQIWYAPTVNLVSGQLLACFEDSCEIYHGGEWNHLADTRATRMDHSTAINEDRILLIGGLDSKHRVDPRGRFSFSAGAV